MSPTFSSRMIPVDWETTHRPLLKTSHNAFINVFAEGSWTFSGGVETWVDGALKHAEVLARIQRQNRATEVSMGEQVEQVVGVMVAFDAELEVARGDIIRVVRFLQEQPVDDVPPPATGDPLLHDLQVVQVFRSSYRFERNVLCKENEHAGGNLNG